MGLRSLNDRERTFWRGAMRGTAEQAVTVNCRVRGSTLVEARFPGRLPRTNLQRPAGTRGRLGQELKTAWRGSGAPAARPR